jgi:hypothetical protein
MYSKAMKRKRKLENELFQQTGQKRTPARLIPGRNSRKSDGTAEDCARKKVTF